MTIQRILNLQTDDNTELMVHPGFKGEADDPFDADEGRLIEYNVLQQFKYINDL